MYVKTGGYRIGAVMLGKDLSKTFDEDRPRYEALYKMGYRAFQVFLIGCSDEYLVALRAWADQQAEDIEVTGLLAFIEPGETGACPISSNLQKRTRALDQVKQSLKLSKLVRSTGLHGPLFQGLMNTGLDDGEPLELKTERMVRFIEDVDFLADAAQHPIGWEVLNMHEFPPPAPTTLGGAAGLFTLANVSAWSRFLLDTCHQGQGEKSTTAAWEKHGRRGSCIHFSDYGRTLPGQEQAFRPSLFLYLAQAKLPLTIYVEAVGNDASAFVKKALHVNNVPDMTGEEVLANAMSFIKQQFEVAI